MEPTFFATPAGLPRLAGGAPRGAAELLVGFHKKGTGRPSITWPESVDEALCFGWIDGVRRSIDDDALRDPLHAAQAAQHLERGQHRAAPGADRRRAGCGRPALAAFERAPRGSLARLRLRAARASTLEPRRTSVQLRADPAAGAFFDAQPPWYRRTATHWVMSAKRDETRERRLQTLIEDSAAGRTVPPLTRPTGAGAG